MDKTKYYVLNKKAVPEVLLKVVEVKHLLATRKGMTIGCLLYTSPSPRDTR